MPSPTAPGGFVVRCQSAALRPWQGASRARRTARRSVTTPTYTARPTARARASARPPRPGFADGRDALRQARELRDRRLQHRRRGRLAGGCVRPRGRGRRRTRCRARRDRGFVPAPPPSAPRRRSDGRGLGPCEACPRRGAQASRHAPTAAAIPPWASRLVEDSSGPFGTSENVALGGGAERREEPRDAPTDDDEIKCSWSMVAVFSCSC